MNFWFIICRDTFKMIPEDIFMTNKILSVKMRFDVYVFLKVS